MMKPVYLGYLVAFVVLLTLLSSACGKYGEHETHETSETKNSLQTSELSSLVSKKYFVRFAEKVEGSETYYIFEVCANTEDFKPSFVPSGENCVNAFKGSGGELMFQELLYDRLSGDVKLALDEYVYDDLYLQVVPFLSAAVFTSPIFVFSRFLDIGQKAALKPLLAVMAGIGTIAYFATKSKLQRAQDRVYKKAEITLKPFAAQEPQTQNLLHNKDLQYIMHHYADISGPRIVRTYDRASDVLRSLAVFLLAWGVATEDMLDSYCLPVSELSENSQDVEAFAISCAKLDHSEVAKLLPASKES